MRILHVLPTYLPAVRYGGPIYSVHALCRALADRGHDVHVYTTNVDGEGVADVPLAEPVVLDGVKISYFPCSLARRLYHSPTMVRAIQANATKFDFFHLHSVFVWPTLAAARVARGANVPYVLSPRGMLVADLIERKNWLLKTAWIRLFERTNVAGASAIHATSDLEQAELVKLDIPAQRVVIIPNGIDLPNNMRTIRQPAISQNPYVLSLGRINWKKGIDRLIKAMAYVPNAELLIAGNDEESYQPALENMVRELGLSERVHFLGPVRGEEKWNLIRSAALCALASHSENFGMVALEAMAYGCPVAVTPQVGLACAISKAGAGVVVDGDAEGIGAAISELVSDPVRRKLMGEAGSKLASQSYAWPRIAEQMEQLYESCMEERTERA